MTILVGHQHVLGQKDLCLYSPLSTHLPHNIPTTLINKGDALSLPLPLLGGAGKSEALYITQRAR